MYDWEDNVMAMTECHNCHQPTNGMLCAYSGGHAYCHECDPHAKPKKPTAKQLKRESWDKLLDQAKQLPGNITRIGAEQK